MENFNNFLLADRTEWKDGETQVVLFYSCRMLEKNPVGSRPRTTHLLPVAVAVGVPLFKAGPPVLDAVLLGELGTLSVPVAALEGKRKSWKWNTISNRSGQINFSNKHCEVW